MMCISISVLEHAYEIEWDILMVQNVCNNETISIAWLITPTNNPGLMQWYSVNIGYCSQLLLTRIVWDTQLMFCLCPLLVTHRGLMDWFSWWTTHMFWLPSYIGVNQKIVISNFKCFNFVFSKVLIILDVVHNDVLKLQPTTPIYLNV